MKNYTSLLSLSEEVNSALKERAAILGEIRIREADASENIVKRFASYGTEILGKIKEIITVLNDISNTHEAHFNRDEREAITKKLTKFNRDIISVTYKTDHERAADQQNEFKQISNEIVKEAIAQIQQTGIYETRDVWQRNDQSPRNLVLVDWDWVGSTSLSREYEGAKDFISRTKNSLHAAASRYGGILWKPLGDRNIYVFESKEQRAKDNHRIAALKCAAEILALVKAANKIQNLETEKFLLPIRIVVQELEDYIYDPKSNDLDELNLLATEKFIVGDMDPVKEVSNAIVVTEEIFNSAVKKRWKEGHTSWSPMLLPHSKLDEDIQVYFLSDVGFDNTASYIQEGLPRYYKVTIPPPLDGPPNEEKYKIGEPVHPIPASSS